MKRTTHRNPPAGAPEGTEWFGGPVDRFEITLRLYGEDLDPDQVSLLLGCQPTRAERKGIPANPTSTRLAPKGSWRLTIKSPECGSDADVEECIKQLFARLPSDGSLWAMLTDRYVVDVFCGLFLTSWNRGFELSADASKLLSDRGLRIGFDVYFDPPCE